MRNGQKQCTALKSLCIWPVDNSCNRMHDLMSAARHGAGTFASCWILHLNIRSATKRVLHFHLTGSAVVLTETHPLKQPTAASRHYKIIQIPDGKQTLLHAIFRVDNPTCVFNKRRNFHTSTSHFSFLKLTRRTPKSKYGYNRTLSPPSPPQGRDPCPDLIVDVDLGAVLQQKLYHVLVASTRSPHQSGHVVLAGHVRVRPGLQ